MKCSAWSSLVISACSALALAAPAAAEVDISPQRIDPGSTSRLVFWVTNETKQTVTAVAIGVPADFQIGEAEAKGSWKTSVRARTATWEGYRIAPGQFAFFTITVRTPNRDERGVFSVLVSLAGGTTLTWPATVSVVPAQPVRDSDARLTATIALAVASIAAALALASGLLGLWLWLRPRPEAF
jgi:uncharacterized protein YcnI